MSGGHALDWNDEIGDDDYKIVDSSWLEGREFHEPPIWDPVRQLTEYLEILFEASENVGYVTASWEKDGKYLPSKGSWDRTAGELIEQLNHCGGGHWGRPGRLQSAGGGLDPLQSHGR